MHQLVVKMNKHCLSHGLQTLSWLYIEVQRVSRNMVNFFLYKLSLKCFKNGLLSV